MEYCEIDQEISQIFVKYPVTTGISQGTAGGPTLWSKFMEGGGTWNLALTSVLPLITFCHSINVFISLQLPVKIHYLCVNFVFQ